MALYTFGHSPITTKFLVSLFNSYLIFLYKRVFINSTAAFQINDARLLPIVIPTSEQLKDFEKVFDTALVLKQLCKEHDLESLQDTIDVLAMKLYTL